MDGKKEDLMRLAQSLNDASLGQVSGGAGDSTPSPVKDCLYGADFFSPTSMFAEYVCIQCPFVIKEALDREGHWKVVGCEKVMA